MKISALQIDIKWGEVQKNISKIETFIASSSADIIILPEMFSTGFSMKPEKIAQSMNDMCVIWMRQCAAKYNKAIMGSIAIKELDENKNEYYVNRLILATPDNKIEYIDKHHLFRMAGEDKVYKNGVERKIFTYKGVRILPLVCYDLRFPVWSRNVDMEYDMIVFVASWPDIRIYAWDILLKARAIENLAYVVGVNRTGEDKSGHYSGHSVIVDYLGKEIARANDNKEEFIEAEISIEALNEFRNKFPAHLDADKFILEK